MSTTKPKHTHPARNRMKEQDKEGSRQFLLILVLGTLALMVLMYLIFVVF